MPVQVTITLDSGCFLPLESEKQTYSEVGYFQSDDSVSDIRVLIDGEQEEPVQQMKLGKDCQIEVRHVRADNSINTDGVTCSPSFHGNLLHMKHLYGEHAPVEKAKFDCVLRFDSGRFCPSMVKGRSFKEHTKQSDGSFKFQTGNAKKLVGQPVAHNVLVLYKLEDDEALELARDDKPFWTSKGKKIEDRIDIEIVADNTTAEKFFRHALKDERDSYWLPNQGDPPPNCPIPPCTGDPGSP
jgi:hypothetical protein